MKRIFCSLLIFASLLFANVDWALDQETPSCFSDTCVDITSIKWFKSDVAGAFNYPVVEARGSREFTNAGKTPAVMEFNCIEGSSNNRFRTVAVWNSEEEKWNDYDSRWSGNSEVVQYICNLSTSQD